MYSASPSPDLTQLSERAREIASAFGIDQAAAITPLFSELRVPNTGIVLIHGDSGSGKSTLLRQIVALDPEIRTPSSLQPPIGSVIDQFPGSNEEAVNWLSRFGLSDARVLITNANSLSEGQQHRLMLARLLWSQPKSVAIDEYLSSLDRTTAMVLAYGFQKICRQNSISAYLCTAHEDLAGSLAPDTIIRLDLSGDHSLSKPTKPALFGRIEEVIFGSGWISELRSLMRFHYRFGDGSTNYWDSVLKEVRTASFRGRVVAARAFCQPFPRDWDVIRVCRQLNDLVLVQEGTVVHPAFRGVGLTRKLTPTVQTEQKFLYAQSAMARYAGFHKADGFKKVSHPSENVLASQLALSKLLVSADPDTNLNSVESVKRTIAQIPRGSRDQLISLTTAAFVESNCRFTKYLADLVGVEISEPEIGEMLEFSRHLANGIAQQDLDSFSATVEGCLPFPVVGLLRTL
jgi:ABC-type lipoprotein export system ATPase subunit